MSFINTATNTEDEIANTNQPDELTENNISNSGEEEVKNPA